MKTCIVIKGRVYSSRWKLIQGSSKYLADASGKIMNALTGEILKPQDNGNGYLRVDLHGAREYVHRIIAKTFLGDPPAPDMHVNHKDYDRANNAACNLEWTTPIDNYRHRDRRTWNVPKTEDVPF